MPSLVTGVAAPSAKSGSRSCAVLVAPSENKSPRTAPLGFGCGVAPSVCSSSDSCRVALERARRCQLRSASGSAVRPWGPPAARQTASSTPVAIPAGRATSGKRSESASRRHRGATPVPRAAPTSGARQSRVANALVTRWPPMSCEKMAVNGAMKSTCVGGWRVGEEGRPCLSKTRKGQRWCTSVHGAQSSPPQPNRWGLAHSLAKRRCFGGFAAILRPEPQSWP
eukprot:scaffold8709_cov103-Isochrysis_galbana.AAC.2